MKKLLWGLGIGSLVLIVAAFLLGRYTFPNTLVGLPTPELSEGQRGELGIDKNVNESTIDSYLGRSNAVYRDLRMLEDPGNGLSFVFYSGSWSGVSENRLGYWMPI